MSGFTPSSLPMSRVMKLFWLLAEFLITDALISLYASRPVESLVVELRGVCHDVFVGFGLGVEELLHEHLVFLPQMEVSHVIPCNVVYVAD